MHELGHPYMWVQSLGGLHFPSDASEVLLSSSTTSVEHTFFVLEPYHVGICCFFFLGGVCRQFFECQPDGENHEATEETCPVPLSFAKTVRLSRYVTYQ